MSQEADGSEWLERALRRAADEVNKWEDWRREAVMEMIQSDERDHLCYNSPTGHELGDTQERSEKVCQAG